jgi:hypothetical protein
MSKQLIEEARNLAQVLSEKGFDSETGHQAVYLLRELAEHIETNCIGEKEPPLSRQDCFRVLKLYKGWNLGTTSFGGSPTLEDSIYNIRRKLILAATDRLRALCATERLSETQAYVCPSCDAVMTRKPTKDEPCDCGHYPIVEG